MGVTIAIDKIVLLIGPNNVGKSTILDAYEKLASGGEPISAAFFHERAGNPVEMEGTFIDVGPDDTEKIGKKWVHSIGALASCVRVKWVWAAPDKKGEKHAWDPATSTWAVGGLGGWDSLIQTCMPSPIRVRPSADPAEQEKQIVGILTAAIKDTLKSDGERVERVLSALNELAQEVQQEVAAQLDQTCKAVEQELVKVFPGHVVSIQAGADKVEPDKLIGAGTTVSIQRPGGSAIALSQQGTGLKRAFLWSAIAALAERSPKKAKGKAEGGKSRILLIDEPESYLHPSAVRSAREALYLLAELPEWQVLASTHSPVFVDVSKPHTTIVRLEREGGGAAFTFCTDRATFSDEEREQLRMIRACNPFVSEFLFADHTVLVEGETEHAVLAMILEQRGAPARDLHVVNCMGKANLALFARILNHFGKPYTIIHDSDSPRAQRRDGKWIKNPAWTVNDAICAEVAGRRPELPPSRVFASIPDFERQYFGTVQEHDKPHAAIARLAAADDGSEAAKEKLSALVDRLLSRDDASDYADVDELAALVQEWATRTSASPPELWSVQAKA